MVRLLGLGEFEGIFYVDAEIPHCVLDFGVAAQQNLTARNDCLAALEHITRIALLPRQ
ncbi:hypothetical protein NKJ26_30440 [Mesorhizobium sp. M0152]|uniref:hypothetical protein n=1 Tax=Mesorhizobium sp. M0152 TaxID=2956898 RepID=UPI003339938B